MSPRTLIVLCALAPFSATPTFAADAPAAVAGTAAAPAPATILADMSRVADWQLAHPSKHALTDWTQGAYYDGMMALADVSPDSKYRNAMLAIGKKTGWNPGPGKHFADDHCVGQMYIELGQRLHDPSFIKPFRDRFDDILATPPKNPDDLDHSIKGCTNKWSWCDALFMAPPTWIRLYEATGDKRYLDFANDRWWHTYDYLFDKEENLYFRDSSYFKKQEANGKKVFWSRGNGWVIAGLARMIQVLPASHPDRPRYEKLFRDMCAKLVSLQGADGLWRTSLLDPASYPAPETSGTGFNTFALAWGVNTGLLDRATYGPAALRGWNGLVRHITADGMLGSCQPIGADPKKIKETDTEVYGTGALLLAGSEMYKAGILAANTHGLVSVKNPGDTHRAFQSVEIPATKLKELTGSGDPAEVLVLDALTARLRDTQPVDTDGDGKPDALLFQTVLPAGDTRKFILVKKPAGFVTPAPVKFAHARFVPERMDDFAWENDRTAHRVYGPTLIKPAPKGEHAVISGVDVWLKSTPVPVLDARYAGKNYHKDNGDGLDCYSVGSSRGCGGTAILAGGKWYPAGNYTSWKLLADGPLRASFELTYGPFDVAGRQVTETKRFTLDAGTDFTRVDAVYTTSGDAPLHAGTGITAATWKGRGLHPHEPFAIPSKDSAPVTGAQVSDWQDNGAKNGFTGVAAGIVGAPAEIETAEGHRFVAATVKPGATLHTYLGAAWSKGGHYATGAEWAAAVAQYQKSQENPVVVTYGE